jgi:phosphatidylinositol phospholipase C delta
MNADAFISFLHNYQKETHLTLEQCLALIAKHEVDERNRAKGQLSFGAFVNYLMSDEELIEGAVAPASVTQNMDLPIFSYFVNSSHNTYLSGDQLTSRSGADCYRYAIMSGARLVEMDVYDGPSGPVIYHQKTLTSKILFEEAIATCSEYAFKLSQ